MKNELDKLYSQAMEEYENEVEVEDVCQSAGAEMPLESISSSKLLRIRKYLEQTYDCRYWLADRLKFNPQKKYMLWIEKTRGNSPVWGISPVTA